MPPPPPRKLSKLPPPKVAGKFVRLQLQPDKTFTVVTLHTGLVVGRRLDRGRGEYPSQPAWGLNRAEGLEQMKVWDKFMELNQSKEERQ